MVVRTGFDFSSRLVIHIVKYIHTIDSITHDYYVAEIGIALFTKVRVRISAYRSITLQLQDLSKR